MERYRHHLPHRHNHHQKMRQQRGWDRPWQVERWGRGRWGSLRWFIQLSLRHQLPPSFPLLLTQVTLRSSPPAKRLVDALFSLGSQLTYFHSARNWLIFTRPNTDLFSLSWQLIFTRLDTNLFSLNLQLIFTRVNTDWLKHIKTMFALAQDADMLVHCWTSFGAKTNFSGSPQFGHHALVVGMLWTWCMMLVLVDYIGTVLIHSGFALDCSTLHLNVVDWCSGLVH